MSTDEAREDAQEHSWWDRPETLRYRAATLLAQISNHRFAAPNTRATIAFHRSIDVQENAEALPGEGERSETLGIWATEAYTPANIEALIRRLRSLGWDKGGIGDRDIVSWLQSARDGAGHSLNLWFFPLHSTGISAIGRRTDLPPFVSHASATLYAVTRSITCLTILFYFEPHERHRFDRTLRAHHPTGVEPNGRSLRIWNPYLQRRRAVAAIRRERRSAIFQWLRDHMPGLFCASGDDAELPTCELTVTVGMQAFEQRGEDWERCRSLEYLEMSFSGSVFEQSGGLAETTRTSLAFAVRPCHEHRLEHHSILTMTKDDLESGVDGLDRGSGEHRYLYGIDRSFRPIFSDWSLPAIVDHYARQIAAARDAASEIVSSRSAIRSLRQLREITSRGADAGTVSRELERYASDGWFRLSEGYSLVLRRWRPTENLRTIGQVLKDTLGERARDLGQDVAELNTFLHAQANLLSAHANLRLQPAIIALAIISAVVGGITAIDPVRSLLQSLGIVSTPVHR